MKKWEACHALGELRREVEDDIASNKRMRGDDDSITADAKTAKRLAEHSDYYAKRIRQLEMFLKALDVAGDALTKGR